MPTRDDCARAQATITFRCAGPYILSETQRTTGEARRRGLVDTGDAAGLQQMAQQLAGLLGRAATGSLETAAAADETLTRLLYARTGCGTDLRAFIAAAPFDGERRQGTCPTCGTVFTFTPPLADEEAASRTVARAAALDAVLGG